MTFIEIIKSAWTECQSGEFQTVVGAAGMRAKFVNWVSSAWVDIQKEKDEWSFLKASTTIEVNDSMDVFTKASVGLSGMRIPLSAFILVDSVYMPLTLLRSISSQDETNRVNKQQAMPKILYFDNGKFSFDSIPDKNYTIKIFYLLAPQRLVNDSDEPIVDEEYQDAIKWKAVETYALDDNDQALQARAKVELERAMNIMYSDLLPALTWGRSAY
jgi:hypothetical protein